jgi:hypothetical protein
MMIHEEIGRYFDGAFKDKRIDKRANEVLDSMIKKASAVMWKSCDSLKSRIGAYRMLKNEKVEIEEMIERISERSIKQIRGERVLVITDTTEINCTNKAGRIREKDKEIGLIGNDKNIGFFIHPALMIEEERGIAIGFSDIKVWNRGMEKGRKSEKQKRGEKIEEKESYKWIETGKRSEERLKGKKQTIIADRESDIYEVISQLRSDRTDLLIRANKNRRLMNGKKLGEEIKGFKKGTRYEIRVSANKERKAREALVVMKYGKVELKKPDEVKGEYPESMEVNCVYVEEEDATIPKGEKGIEWCLLTTHEVRDEKEAQEKVEWYKKRWYIEEIFRLIKSEGINVEGAQLESGKGLKKLAILGLIAGWHIMLLKMMLDKKEEKEGANIIFTDKQMELLEMIGKKKEGKTEKQKNPYKEKSFAWAAWIIARLGGWTGYESQAKAGYITFRDGYKDFQSKFEAFELFST